MPPIVVVAAFFAFRSIGRDRVLPFVWADSRCLPSSRALACVDNSNVIGGLSRLGPGCGSCRLTAGCLPCAGRIGVAELC